MSNKAEKRGVIPKLRFSEFRDAEEWRIEFGDVLFDQISNKDHNSDLPVLAITQEQGAIPRYLIDYHVSVTEKSIESYKVVEVGDFIISLRSFQGGIEYSNYKGICSPAYVILRLKAGNSAGYFKHFLKTSRFITLLTKNLEGLRDGKMVSYKQFSELQLPTPSLNEQQKIADCLASLDERITLEAQKLDTLKAHKKGLMQQLFPAEGKTLPKLRFPEFREAGEWKKKELRKVAVILNKRAGSNKYRLMSITAGVGLISQLEKFGREIAGAQYKNYLVIEKNDFAYNKSATKEYPEGFIGMYSGNEPGAVPNSIFTCFQVDASTVSPKYLAYLFIGNLHGKWLKKFITVGARAHGSLNIDDNDLLAVPIPYPQGDHSLLEQQKIADCLASLDDLITAQTQKLAALKTHKKGLMQQLFPTIPNEREVGHGTV